MKKTWSTPEVMDVTLNSTAYNAFVGTTVDGVYTDQDCGVETEAYES